MTIFDQFRRENSNISTFVLLKIVNFDTKIRIDHFSSFWRICSFWTQNGPLTHCAQSLIFKISENHISLVNATFYYYRNFVTVFWTITIPRPIYLSHRILSLLRKEEELLKKKLLGNAPKLGRTSCNCNWNNGIELCDSSIQNPSICHLYTHFWQNFVLVYSKVPNKRTCTTKKALIEHLIWIIWGHMKSGEVIWGHFKSFEVR